MARPEKNWITFEIDGREVRAEEGAMLVDAAKHGDVDQVHGVEGMHRRLVQGDPVHALLLRRRRRYPSGSGCHRRGHAAHGAAPLAGASGAAGTGGGRSRRHHRPTVRGSATTCDSGTS